MSYGLVQTSAPAAEPIDLTEAKAHLKVEVSDDDSLINTLIAVARKWSEERTGRAFVTQTWQLKLDEFPQAGEVLYVPKPPLQSVSSIQYVDTNGATQTWAAADYLVDTTRILGRVTPAYEKTWPSTRQQMAAVTATFVCGYGAASAVPEPLKQAIKLLVGHLYEHREAVVDGVVTEVPLAAEALLAPYWTGEYR